MTDSGENSEQKQPAKRPHVSDRPPIFALYDLIRRQPMVLGALLGLLVGLVLANQTGIRTEVAVVGGAIGGAVVARIIEQAL